MKVSSFSYQQSILLAISSRMKGTCDVNQKAAIRFSWTWKIYLYAEAHF